jgi:adenine-specific DNA methylase
MSIEENFNIPFIAELALREKQIQQNYRPIIAVHKWFARRPGTLFRGLILAEFGDAPVEDLFFQANSFPGKRVADPFMGGGTPLIEANRVGCDVLGFDINPMSAWIVREEIEHLDLPAYQEAAAALLKALRADLDGLYRTDCPLYGDKNVPVKYFLWVKEIDCEACGEAVPLYPGYLLSENARHPANVLVCSQCGQLNETDRLDKLGACRDCDAALILEGPARRGRCACPKCQHINTYPRPESGPPRHRLFAIEYYNPARKAGHQGRFFKKADAQDIARYRKAERRWRALSPLFVPDQPILAGDETDRLHRWGYELYSDLFNPRQLLGLEQSARLISAVVNQRVRHALATNLSDLLRYQNMLCRYDTMALKSLDIFSVHGFPAGLVQAESNLLGIVNGNDINVGSGGWTNIIEKYTKAKRYCDAPFEVRRRGAQKIQVPIDGEWIGERMNGHQQRSVTISCANSGALDLPAASLDAVFTDPPYFGNVQYGELMDFCYVWLRRLVGHDAAGFERESSRDSEELTVNQTEGRDLEHFTEGLADVYANMARALKPGAPLAFTYHHNKLEAYQAIAVGILDAGLTCSAALPCPAEMGGSIHIHGTGSSIVDTVFVCRSTGATARQGLCETPDQLAALVANELDQLRAAGMKPTAGDVRCIVFGHVTRLAVWMLRPSWDASQPTAKKLALVADAMTAFGDLPALIERCRTLASPNPQPGRLFAHATRAERSRNAVAF